MMELNVSNVRTGKPRSVYHRALLSDRTFAVGVLWMQGHSIADSAERLAVGEATVERHRQKFSRYCEKTIPVDNYRKMFMALMPLAYNSLKGNLERQHPSTTLAYLEGMKVFSPQVVPNEIMNVPTEELVARMLHQIADVPALRLMIEEELAKTAVPCLRVEETRAVVWEQAGAV